jgi:hypothetical protein
MRYLLDSSKIMRGINSPLSGCVNIGLQLHLAKRVYLGIPVTRRTSSNTKTLPKMFQEVVETSERNSKEKYIIFQQTLRPILIS